MNISWKSLTPLFFGLLISLSYPLMAKQGIVFNLEDEPIYTSSSKTSPGILNELVMEMSKHLDISPEVKFYPWKRAQINTIKTPNAIIFPLTRTTARESQYNWVCKLFDVPVMFINKQGKPKINTVNDARALKKIATVIGSAQGNKIKEFNLNDVIQVKGASLYALLNSGRVDAVYSAQPEAIYAWKKEQHKGKLQYGATIQVLPLWIASSKDAPKIDNKKWIMALQKIKNSGFFAKKYSEYFSEKMSLRNESEK